MAEELKEHAHACHDLNCADPSHHHHHHGHGGPHEPAGEALVLSLSRSFRPESELSTQELRARGERCILRLGELLGADGIVAGHIKGIIEAGEGSLALSLTRVGAVDVTELGYWGTLKQVRAYTMTVNVISLVSADITEDDLFCGMDGK